jgi:hypothetical protein
MPVSCLESYEPNIQVEHTAVSRSIIEVDTFKSDIISYKAAVKCTISDLELKQIKKPKLWLFGVGYLTYGKVTDAQMVNQ